MKSRIRGSPRHLAALVALASALACVGEVSGDRQANGGACPEGEVCSDLTPNGLTFVGQVFYDEAGATRLGPVISGGTFDLGFKLPDGSPLGSYVVEVEGDAIATESASEPFVLPEVTDHVVLRGRSLGEVVLRIVDPQTGELYDRLTFPSYELKDVWIGPAHEPDRTELYGGTEEMMGVHVIATDGEHEIRAFDQDMSMLANGTEAVPEAGGTWDCFGYQVPEDADEIVFELDVGGQTFTHTMPVVAP